MMYADNPEIKKEASKQMSKRKYAENPQPKKTASKRKYDENPQPKKTASKEIRRKSSAQKRGGEKEFKACVQRKSHTQEKSIKKHYKSNRDVKLKSEKDRHARCARACLSKLDLKDKYINSVQKALFDDRTTKCAPLRTHHTATAKQAFTNQPFINTRTRSHAHRNLSHVPGVEGSRCYDFPVFLNC